MKKRTSPTVLLLALVLCGSSERAAAQAPVRVTNLKPRIAVLGISAPEQAPEVVQALEETISAAATRYTSMEVVAASDMKALLNLGAVQQIMGCSDAGCLGEVGNMLAVQQLISGNVKLLSGKAMLNLRRIDLVNGVVLERASMECDNDPQALIAQSAQATAVLFGVVGRIAVWNQPEQAELFLDGALVGETPAPPVVVTKPGEHEVLIAGPGITSWRQTVSITAGADLRLRALNQSLIELEERASSRRETAYWVGGAAVASALTATVFYVLAAQNDSRLNGLDPRIATQAELDEITGTTFNLTITSAAFGLVALALGGTCTYLLIDNPAADILADHGYP